MQKHNFLTNDVGFGTQSCFGPSVFISYREVQQLNSLVDEIKDLFLEIFGRELRSEIEGMVTPKIVPSDETPSRTFGKYDTEDLIEELETYIDKLREENLGELIKLLKRILWVLSGDARYDGMENTLTVLVAKAEKEVERLGSEFDLASVMKVLQKIKERKIEHKILGKYRYSDEYGKKDNSIVIYGENIISCYGATYDSKKVRQALEFVFVHEMFHAIHFWLMGKNDSMRFATWAYKFKRNRDIHNDERNTILESLATYFELQWCIRKCQWHVAELERDMTSYLYPAYPYAGLIAFWKCGNYAARSVLNMGRDSAFKEKPFLGNRKQALDEANRIHNFGEFWKNAYRALDWCGKAW